MKTLTILRHAKSSWEDPALKDVDRPLNERGRKAARLIGKEMKRRKMRFDLVLASPAMRIRQTLDELAGGYGQAFDVRFEPEIYMASVGALLALIRDMPESSKRPLLVGHNPGLQELVTDLTYDDKAGLRRRAAEKFPTGALAVIELNIEWWRDAAEGAGELVELTFPRDLD